MLRFEEGAFRETTSSTLICVESRHVFSNVDKAAGDDGRAHADNCGLLDQVEARSENHTPAAVLVDPGANLKTNENVENHSL